MGALVLLLAGALASASPAESPADQALKAFVVAYDGAFNAKDLARLAAFYHPEVTIFEGGHVNTGWLDYRDNHLGPELKEMAPLLLLKDADGSWRMRHSHTSSRRRPAAPSAKP